MIELRKNLPGLLTVGAMTLHRFNENGIRQTMSLRAAVALILIGARCFHGSTTDISRELNSMCPKQCEGTIITR